MKLLRKIFFFFSPILSFTVQEESMMPLLKPGDRILVYKLFYLFQQPKVGDIIVFISPEDGKYLVKYIEKIAIQKKPLYFMMGKNKAKSRDSRHFGWVSRDKIIGKMLL